MSRPTDSQDYAALKESDDIEIKRLKMLNAELAVSLEQMTHYAQCALDQFSNGRGHLDISAFHSLIREARAVLDKINGAL